MPWKSFGLKKHDDGKRKNKFVYRHWLWHRIICTVCARDVWQHPRGGAGVFLRVFAALGANSSMFSAYDFGDRRVRKGRIYARDR